LKGELGWVFENQERKKGVTFYMVCYNSSTTHPSQPIYTFNELHKRKKKKT